MKTKFVLLTSALLIALLASPQLALLADTNEPGSPATENAPGNGEAPPATGAGKRYEQHKDIDYKRVREYKIGGIVLIVLFLPITAATYYWFRRYRRDVEIERVLSILEVNHSYQRVYHDERPGFHHFLAVLYTTVLALIGLAGLFLGSELKIPELPWLEFGDTVFPQHGSRLVFGMAFLGGYLWGLQNIFHRYVLNDLLPAVYYGLSLRMLMAATVALVIFNAYEALMGTGPGNAVADTVWPALAFMLGMFPQRGLRWLTRHMPIIAPATNPTVKEAPLEMIQGMNIYDQLRLEEVGIQTCYGLANADFVPLMLKTPYGARELVDWILQAKLVVYFGAGVKDLREHGIRTIVDLAELDEEHLISLSTETSLTEYALVRARRSVEGNEDIERLKRAGQLLSKYWEREPDPDPAPPRGSKRGDTTLKSVR